MPRTPTGSAELSPAVAEPPRVQSLGRAFSILEAIAERAEGIALADLSKLVQLHNSTAFHLVKTMLGLGYVRQDAETKRYHIGHKLFGLAAGANNETNLVFLAEPVLKELARISKETCHVAIRAADEVLTIAKADGVSSIRMSERLGAPRPAYCTAIGKVFLAAMSQSQLDGYLQRTHLQGYTPHTILDVARLRREIEMIRQAGVAIDNAEFNPDARCIAAPVYDFSGRMCAAMGISGPMWRVTAESSVRIQKIVIEHASQLSMALGYRGQRAHGETLTERLAGPSARRAALGGAPSGPNSRAA